MGTKKLASRSQRKLSNAVKTKLRGLVNWRIKGEAAPTAMKASPQIIIQASNFITKSVAEYNLWTTSLGKKRRKSAHSDMLGGERG